MNMNPKILLIEDDASTAASLKKVLCAEGYEVETSGRGDAGLELARQNEYNVVISDLRLPGLGGLDLVAQLHAAKPKQPIILMTAHGTTETAIEATKLGACDYLLKPFEADELLDLVASAVASSRLMSEPVEMGEARTDQSAIIGKSRAMQAIYKEIGRVAATPATVLIRGATGTGKELIARAIYQHSLRADKPFIAVNCAAIPDALLESELFGHERGAFTGAQARRIGRFEQAHGGTIFLDEIGDLNANTQGKLLRVLQERCIQRLGSEANIPVDVRVLAATHRSGLFRPCCNSHISVLSTPERVRACSATSVCVSLSLLCVFSSLRRARLGVGAPGSLPPDGLSQRTWLGKLSVCRHADEQRVHLHASSADAALIAELELARLRRRVGIVRGRSHRQPLPRTCCRLLLRPACRPSRHRTARRSRKEEEIAPLDSPR